MTPPSDTGRRIFYAAGGQADLVGAQQWVLRSEDHPLQVSITFSSQIIDAINRLGGKGMLVSDRGDGAQYADDRLIIEHLAKGQGSGVAYYWFGLRYTLTLIQRARAFGADLALIDSGVIPYFLMGLFRLFGIPVIPIVHNSLWPEGYPPQGLGRRIVQWLDSRFWRRGPAACIVVSPVIERQIRSLAPSLRYPVRQSWAQFHRSYFQDIAPPTWLTDAPRPFRMAFVGRMTADKGVFDVVAMADRIQQQSPGLVEWIVCGEGADLSAMRAAVAAKGLVAQFDIRGYTSAKDMADVYGKVDACIVPTTSHFPEGLAMTAIEAVAAGRPLISNPVVPAVEFTKEATIVVRTDDVDAYVDAIIRLATDRAQYSELQGGTGQCDIARFFDRDYGLGSLLSRMVPEALSQK